MKLLAAESALPLPHGRGSAGPPAVAGLNRKRQRGATHGLGVAGPPTDQVGQACDLPPSAGRLPHGRGSVTQLASASGYGQVILAICLVALSACSGGSKPQTHEAEPTPAASTTPATAAPDNRKIVAVFGDSIAAGFGLEPGQSFPDDIQKKLDAQALPWRVVNLGISGDTTEGGVARIDSRLRSTRPS